MENKMKIVRCIGCGAKVNDIDGPTHPYMIATAACWELYGQVLAKEYENQNYFKVHRLTVDAYAVQHPGIPERKSIQSVNIHLIALCLAFEHDMEFSKITAKMGEVIKKFEKQFAWLTPPKTNYPITVKDILTAATADEHVIKVRSWAQSVWQIWQNDHGEKISKYSHLIIRDE